MTSASGAPGAIETTHHVVGEGRRTGGSGVGTDPR